MYGALRSGKSMSVLLQSPDSRLRGHRSESSSSGSTASAQSPRHWYHRTLDRIVPQSGSTQRPSRLRTSTSIKGLARKATDSLPKTTHDFRHLFSAEQGDLDQRNESLVQLPGSPGGQNCHPLGLLAHDRTFQSLELLTPDHSGLSVDSSGPATPDAAESIRSMPLLTKGFLGQVMGNSDSKLASTRVSEIMRKPVASLLKTKKSQHPLDNEVSSTQSDGSQPVSGHEPQPALDLEQAELTRSIRQANESSVPIGPPPVLRHRASSSQVQVPRRRSSLTAIHLDSSHFEKPSSSKQSGHGNHENRASSFSESFQPVATPSNSATIVASPNTQEDNKSSAPQSPRLLSPPPSNHRPSSADSSLSQRSATPKPTQIYFPVTWPNGGPDLKPAALTSAHHHCSRTHAIMIREKALFNQVPCMTCGIHDRKERYTCHWCELRVCDKCMRQLASVSKRSLALLLERVARRQQGDHERQPEISLKQTRSREPLKHRKSNEASQEMKIVERKDSNAQNVIADESNEMRKIHKDLVQSTAGTNLEKGQNMIDRVHSIEMVRKEALIAI